MTRIPLQGGRCEDRRVADTMYVANCGQDVHIQGRGDDLHHRSGDDEEEEEGACRINGYGNGHNQDRGGFR